MFKVPIDVLEKCKSNIQDLSILLTMSHNGKKLNHKQVCKILVDSNKILNILKENYEV